VDFSLAIDGFGSAQNEVYKSPRLFPTGTIDNQPRQTRPGVLKIPKDSLGTYSVDADHSVNLGFNVLPFQVVLAFAVALGTFFVSIVHAGCADHWWSPFRFSGLIIF
jgi:hypothetical protein